MSNSDHVCFNCQRSEMEIPVLAWRYQGQMVWVCRNVCPCSFTNGSKWPKKCSHLKNKQVDLPFLAACCQNGVFFGRGDIDKFIKLGILLAALLIRRFNILNQRKNPVKYGFLFFCL